MYKREVVFRMGEDLFKKIDLDKNLCLDFKTSSNQKSVELETNKETTSYDD
jgi:hypothetical protein